MNILSKNKNIIKNALIILLVIFWCVYPSYLEVEKQQTIQYNLTSSDATGYNTIEIKQGDVFSQDIVVNKYIEDLRLLVANGGGNRAQTNNGSIEFILSQGDVVEAATIDIAGVQDWSRIDVPVNLDRFNNGTAQLQIKGIDTQIGSSIYIVSMQEDIYDLSPAEYNGSKLNGPLTVEYITHNNNFNANYFIVLVALIILVGIILVVLLTYNSKDIYIYLATTVIIALIISLKYPTYTIAGEAWAEVGALYIPSAMDKSFIGNLLTLEAGLYLNTMGRLISWLFIKLLPSIHFAPMCINIASLAILSLMGASLSGGVLKKYISPLASVVISVLITTCLVDGETIATPVITAYWGVIPLLIIMAAMALQINIPKKLFVFWSVLVALSVLSRMSFVIFIPIIVMYIIWFRKKLTKSNIIYLLVLSVLCFAEGLISLILRNVQGMTGTGSVAIPSPLTLINGILYYQVQVINSIFNLSVLSDADIWNVCVLVILLALIATLLWCVFRNIHADYAKGALLFIAISFGQCCLQLVTEGFSPLPNGIDWSIVQNLYRNRLYFFCYIAVLAFLLLTFKYYKFKISGENGRKTKISEKIIICYVLIMAFSVQPVSTFDSIYNMNKDIGDWNNYYKMMENEEYCVMVAPLYPLWKVSKECLIEEQQVSRTQEIEFKTELSKVVSFYIQKNSVTDQLGNKPYYMTLYDKNGKEIDTIRQVSELGNNLIGFDINIPIDGLSKISFHYEDGKSAYVEGDYVLAYKKDENNG